MNEFTQTALFVRSNDLLASDMDGDVVMMSIERGEYFGLNVVGARIWQALSKAVTVSEIATAICAEFEVAQDQCERDVQEFLKDCIAKSIVVPVDAHSAS